MLDACEGKKHQKEEQKNILTMFKKRQEEQQLAGHKVKDSTHTFRLQVVAALVSAGVPLHALDDPRFRALLAEQGKLTSASHMAECVPFLLEQEVAKLAAVVRGQFALCSFDSRQGCGVCFRRNLLCF